MFRTFAIALGLLSLISFTVPEFSPVAVSTAYAQSQDAKPKRKSLLQLLFGKAIKRQQKRQEARAKARSNSSTKRAKVVKVKRRSNTGSSSSGPTSNASSSAVVVAAPVDKNEDAVKVLVVGDFMAGQLSSGLERAFSQNPGIVIVDGSVALSGMVRDDVRDWPGTIAEMMDVEEPIVVVALVGMNDRQMIRVSEGRFQKLTEEWRTVYERRTDTLARSIREKRVPMIWVGLPPVSKNSMNSDYLKFNEIYRRTVETYGGEYVDVWNGFVDAEGRYFRSGPDVNGQIVSLRRADGINMTQNGQDKLAFYVEKAIKKVTGFSKDPLVSSFGPLADIPVTNESQYDPVGTGKTVVIALAGPAADGGSTLEGAEGFMEDSDARSSVSFELVASGRSAQPREGRIDSQWGIPSFELERGETPEPVLANMRGINLKSYLDGLPPIPEGEDKSQTEGVSAPSN